jgi:uncharacterized protein (TIGR02172 family)
MEYQNIDISTWTQVGEGGNGKTYVHPGHPDFLLKVNNPPRCDEATVKQELDFAQHVYALGIPTPRMFDMVRVGDGYGQLVELIKGKKSLSRICADESSRIGEMAKLLASLGLRLHAIPCNTDFFPSRKELALKGIDASDFVDDADKEKLRAFLQGVEDEKTCLHGDFQMGNLIISADGKPYWIDLGWFSHGSPMFDMGHLFLVCQVYSQFPTAQDIFHMSQEQLKNFWNLFAEAYTGNKDISAFTALAGKFAPLDVCIRSILMPTPDAYKKLFAGVVHSLVEKFY